MKTNIDRRLLLRAGLGGMISLPVLGGLTACSSKADPLPVQSLTDTISLITGAPGNVLVHNTGSGFVVVDPGSESQADAVLASLATIQVDTPVSTIINTHYHHDQTGANATLASRDTEICSHVITKQWLSAKYYVPATDSWVAPLPEAGRPMSTFREQHELAAGNDTIAMGYLLEAHTRGDIYVYFRNANVLAVGDVASPLRDPELDWYTGAWIGGRVDAMDDLLEVANDDTLIVPAYGPVMSKAELQAERDMMMHLYERTTGLTVKGHDAQDMLNAGVMDEIDRKFENPYKFLYDVAKGNWAHYTNFGGQTV